MTIAFVMAGFLVLWLSLGLYYKTLGSATADAGTLLILTFSFAFSLIVADFVTGRVTRVVFKIQNQEESNKIKADAFVPHEIKVITEHFEKLNTEIAAEKDEVLKLTAGVAHDLRGPLTAMNYLTNALEASPAHEVVHLLVRRCHGG